MPAVLVLLDREIRWDGGDGGLAWLREQCITPRVSVVLTATAGCPPDVLGDIRRPVVKLLPKPFTMTALLDTCRNMADLLPDLRYVVDAAGGGDMALEKAGRQPYDLGLLDLRNPVGAYSSFLLPTGSV
jgi:hypothetical protein